MFAKTYARASSRVAMLCPRNHQRRHQGTNNHASVDCARVAVSLRCHKCITTCSAIGWICHAFLRVFNSIVVMLHVLSVCSHGFRYGGDHQFYAPETQADNQQYNQQYYQQHYQQYYQHQQNPQSGTHLLPQPTHEPSPAAVAYAPSVHAAAQGPTTAHQAHVYPSMLPVSASPAPAPPQPMQPSSAQHQQQLQTYDAYQAYQAPQHQYQPEVPAYQQAQQQHAYNGHGAYIHGANAPPAVQPLQSVPRSAVVRTWLCLNKRRCWCRCASLHRVHDRACVDVPVCNSWVVARVYSSMVSLLGSGDLSVGAWVCGCACWSSGNAPGYYANQGGTM
eukprot:m.1157898 g.1157898  ORF g.1157898 m.1157898 type:complete len:334 (-) comp24498_c0_seq18:2651-3652(-)